MMYLRSELFIDYGFGEPNNPGVFAVPMEASESVNGLLVECKQQMGGIVGRGKRLASRAGCLQGLVRALLPHYLK